LSFLLFCASQSPCISRPFVSLTQDTEHAANSNSKVKHRVTEQQRTAVSQGYHQILAVNVSAAIHQGWIHSFVVRQNPLAGCEVELDKHHDGLERDFYGFTPELISFSAQEARNLALVGGNAKDYT
jgi:hypothetical protein